MASNRPVRIARNAGDSPPHATPIRVPVHARAESTAEREPAERRTNVGGSQRAVRVTAAYLIALVALYVGFLVYDRSAPGGNSSPASNGILVLTGIFAAFAVAGAVFTLHPSPRAIEVARDRVTVVGRWGRRRDLPPLEKLTVRVARRYRAGLLSSAPAEQVEVWAPDLPMRTYLVETDLFAGAKVPDAAR